MHQLNLSIERDKREYSEQIIEYEEIDKEARYILILKIVHNSRWINLRFTKNSQIPHTPNEDVTDDGGGEGDEEVTLVVLLQFVLFEDWDYYVVDHEGAGHCTY